MTDEPQLNWFEKLILVAAILWDSREPRRFPIPDLKGAKGRRYTSPEQGHAPADAPHIPEGEI